MKNAIRGRYEDGSFDAVVDKGTLDALMSEDTAEVRESGAAMLREVRRILKPAGRSVQIISTSVVFLHVSDSSRYQEPGTQRAVKIGTFCRKG